MGRKEGQAAILSDKELRTVINSFKGTTHAERNTAMLLLSFKAGLRAKEIAAITLDDVLTMSGKTTYISAKVKCKSDDIRETITLRSAVSKGNKIDKAYIRCDELREALLNYLPVRKVAFEKGKVDSFFITQKGTTFSPTTMAHKFMAMSKDSSVEFSSHSGRRTLCTNLVQKGINVFDVQGIMRHADISTTMLYYQKDERRLGQLMEET